MKKLITLVLITLISFNAYAYQASDTVGTPTAREDGTALGVSEIEKITVYCGMKSGDYVDEYVMTDIKLPRTTITVDRPAGLSYCVATATDIDGRQSPYSPEFTVNADAASLPMPPTIEQGMTIRVIITLPTVQ